MFCRSVRKPNRITGAIFDLDGTLLDTMSQWNSLGAEYLRNLGIEPKPDLHERLGTMSLRESATFFHKEYGVHLSVSEIIDSLLLQLQELYTTKARLKFGAIDTLRLLKRGGVDIALATATSSELAKAGLLLTGALKFFDCVFSCRDPEVGEGKTSPRIYDVAHAFLGGPKEEIVVVEDALYAIETAKRAGYFVIAIEDESERNHRARIGEIADIYVHNHKELYDWFESRLYN